MSALFDVRRQLWVRLDLLSEAGANCKVHARAMLEGLPANCLLLFDLGYYAFEWFDDLTHRDIWWISRMRSKGSFTVQHVFVESEDYVERLVQLGAYRTDRAASTVRLVEFRYRGTWYSYLTNVLNPLVLSGSQIAQLYARRWDIELAFRLLKQYLGLRVLWSAKWEVILVQMWACAILAQFFHALQVRLAAEAEVEVFDVSLKILLEHVTQRIWAGTLPPLSDMLTELKDQGRRIELIRPSSRITMVVPDVAWTGFDWPPADLVYERPPRYGHRPAGNLNRKGPPSCVT
jgi:Transposase DDE domain